METELTGCFTVDDNKLYPYLSQLKDSEDIFIEPSACAAFEGLKYVCGKQEGFPAPDENSIHIIWATGGNMVPADEKELYYAKGKQKDMEDHVEITAYQCNVLQKETLNGMMKLENGQCSYDEKTLSFDFPVQQWQVNRVGNMHGGMICTAFDITISALARFYAGENFAPTISLDVKYIRPVKVGDTLIIKAIATATGKRITQLIGEAYSKETGKLAATAASVYMNVDTVKERA
jgi:uncharacterized protein (TIGR00369 family)